MSDARNKPLPVVAVTPSAKAGVSFVGDEGAQIFVDDHPVGDVPSAILLSEGMHRIRITKTGFADVLSVIELSAGSSVTPQCVAIFQLLQHLLSFEIIRSSTRVLPPALACTACPFELEPLFVRDRSPQNLVHLVIPSVLD
jgi:hypothetical protein